MQAKKKHKSHASQKHVYPRTQVTRLLREEIGLCVHRFLLYLELILVHASQINCTETEKLPEHMCVRGVVCECVCACVCDL